MTPEEKAEMDQLKADLKASKDLIAESSRTTAKFTQSQAEKDQEIERLRKDNEATKFAVEKSTVEADLETLVKEDKIAPAQRDKLLAGLTADTISNVKFTVETLKENAPIVKNKQPTGKEGDKDPNKDQSADTRVMIAARKFSAENRIDFSAAVQHVLATDPELAREYADCNDEEAA